MVNETKTYLPTAMWEIAELKAICEAEQPEKVHIIACMNQDLDDTFIPTISEDGIEHWESMLGIVPPGDATVSDRQFELLARVNNHAPFSYNRILQMMDAVMGGRNYDFTPSFETFELEVRIHLGSKYKLRTITTMLENCIPAHIALHIDLKYNSHQTLGGFTHSTLAKYTQKQLRDSVIQ